MSKSKKTLRFLLKTVSLIAITSAISIIGSPTTASADPGYAGNTKVIKSVADPKKVLTQEGGSVYFRENNGTFNQIWDVIYSSNGDYYFLKNKESGLYLRYNYNPDAAQRTEIGVSANNDRQASWNIYNMYGTGKVVMQNKFIDTRYLRRDEQDKAIAAFNEYEYRDYNSFYISDPEKINEGEHFVSLASDSSKVWDKSMDPNDNNVILAYKREGGANQKWVFVYDTNKKAYQIKNSSNTNLVITYSGNTAGFIFANQNNDGNSQYWVKEDMENGLVRFKNVQYNTKYLNEWRGSIIASTWDESYKNSYLFKVE